MSSTRNDYKYVHHFSVKEWKDIHLCSSVSLNKLIMADLYTSQVP